MRLRTIAIPLALALAAGCASSPDDDIRLAEQLALYRAHAIERVNSIPFSGSIDRWTGLGETALVVWTSPGRAWLLDLGNRCPDLDTAYAIAFDSNDGRVDAGFDSVVPLGSGMQFPCRIEMIHRVDVDAVRAAERAQASGT